jgi:NitT/TauT family transport system substrate-binding protein
VLAASLAFLSPASLAAGEPTKISFAISHPAVGVGEEIYLYFVPKHLGYFEQEGLDVDLKVGGTVALAAQALQNGSLQFATTTAPIILKTREQGGDLLAIDNLKTDPGQPLAVLPDSPIKKLEDVKGRTIGSLEWGSQGGLALTVSLAQLGIGPSDYNRVNTGAGPTAATALRSHQVDGLALWDAMYGAMENGGLTLRYIDMPVARLLSGFSLAVSQRYAEANPKVVEGFCRAVNKALYFAHVNTTAAVSILLDDFPSLIPAGADRNVILKNDVHIFDDYLTNTLRGIPEGGETGRIPPEVWSFVADYNRKSGNLQGTVAPEKGYTDRFFAACNNFDRKPIAAAAHAYGQ